jgi:hypothetical protein
VSLVFDFSCDFWKFPVEVLLVCNWSHSIAQNHFFVKMLFNRHSAIQKYFQKILHSLQVRKFSSLLAVRTPSCPMYQPSA